MVIQISHLESPELDPYRTLRRPEEHWRQRIFVAEGEKLVRRLLQSGLAIVSFLMTPQWKEEIFPDDSSVIQPIYVGSKQLLQTIVGFPLHQGVMAVAKMPEESSLEKFLSVRKEALLVAFDGVANAENVGVAVRNCAAFGVDAVLVDRTSSSPWLRRAVRNSMGGVFQLKTFHISNLAIELPIIKEKHGIRVVAAHPAGTETLTSIDLTGSAVLVFGSEASGISGLVRNQADFTVSIPMQKNVDSLNVASAVAIFLNEAYRQRH